MYLLCIKHNKQSEKQPNDFKKPDDVQTFTALNMNSNTAYGQANCIPTTSNKINTNLDDDDYMYN